MSGVAAANNQPFVYRDNRHEAYLHQVPIDLQGKKPSILYPESREEPPTKRPKLDKTIENENSIQKNDYAIASASSLISDDVIRVLSSIALLAQQSESLMPPAEPESSGAQVFAASAKQPAEANPGQGTADDDGEEDYEPPDFVDGDACLNALSECDAEYGPLEDDYEWWDSLMTAPTASESKVQQHEPALDDDVAVTGSKDKSTGKETVGDDPPEQKAKAHKQACVAQTLSVDQRKERLAYVRQKSSAGDEHAQATYNTLRLFENELHNSLALRRVDAVVSCSDSPQRQSDSFAFNDIFSLNEGQWYTSSVIDVLLSLVYFNAGRPSHCRFLQTSDYDWITERFNTKESALKALKDPGRASAWAQTDEAGYVEVAKGVQYVVVPVLFVNHWCLAVLDAQEIGAVCHVSLYDTKHGALKNTRELSNTTLLKFVEVICRNPLNSGTALADKTQFRVIWKPCPRQVGSDDCGPLMLYNAERVFQGLEPELSVSGKHVRLRHAALLEKYTQSGRSELGIDTNTQLLERFKHYFRRADESSQALTMTGPDDIHTGLEPRQDSPETVASKAPEKPETVPRVTRSRAAKSVANEVIAVMVTPKAVPSVTTKTARKAQTSAEKAQATPELETQQADPRVTRAKAKEAKASVTKAASEIKKGSETTEAPNTRYAKVVEKPASKEKAPKAPRGSRCTNCKSSNRRCIRVDPTDASERCATCIKRDLKCVRAPTNMKCTSCKRHHTKCVLVDAKDESKGCQQCWSKGDSCDVHKVIKKCPACKTAEQCVLLDAKDYSKGCRPCAEAGILCGDASCMQCRHSSRPCESRGPSGHCKHCYERSLPCSFLLRKTDEADKPAQLKEVIIGMIRHSQRFSDGGHESARNLLNRATELKTAYCDRFDAGSQTPPQLNRAFVNSDITMTRNYLRSIESSVAWIEYGITRSSTSHLIAEDLNGVGFGYEDRVLLGLLRAFNSLFTPEERGKITLLSNGTDGACNCHASWGNLTANFGNIEFVLVIAMPERLNADRSLLDRFFSNISRVKWCFFAFEALANLMDAPERAVEGITYEMLGTEDKHLWFLVISEAIIIFKRHGLNREGQYDRNLFDLGKSLKIRRNMFTLHQHQGPRHDPRVYLRAANAMPRGQSTT